MLHIQFRPNYFSTSFDLSFFDQTFSTWLYVACLKQFAQTAGSEHVECFQVLVQYSKTLQIVMGSSGCKCREDHL